MNTIIKQWSDLEDVHCESDSLTFIVKDPKTNKLRFIDVTINTIAGPNEPLYEDFVTLYGDPNVIHERNS